MSRLGVIAALVVAVLSGCDVSTNIDNKGSCDFPSGQPSSGQCQYDEQIISNRGALQPGYIIFPKNISVPLDQSVDLAIAVCGAAEELYCGIEMPAYAEGSAQSEQSRDQGVQLVGARIHATLTGGADGEIQALSPEIQPVITSSDQATWIWSIDASHSGSSELIATITPLQGDTDLPLAAGIVLPIQVEVTASGPQRAVIILGKVYNFLISLGGLLSILGVTFGTISLWAFRMVRSSRKKHSRSAIEAAKTASDSKLTAASRSDSDENDKTPSSSELPINLPEDLASDDEAARGVSEAAEVITNEPAKTKIGPPVNDISPPSAQESRLNGFSWRLALGLPRRDAGKDVGGNDVGGNGSGGSDDAHVHTERESGNDMAKASGDHSDGDAAE